MRAHARGLHKAEARLKTKISRVMTTSRLLVLAIMAASITLLQGCGGNSNNITASTTGNPAPGVTLQAIQITPSTSLIGLAENRQLRAIGVYSDGGSIDITSQVTWSSSSAGSATNFVTINSQGVATGAAIGLSVVSATLGPVIGVLQLEVETNGYTSNTIAVLSVPYKTSILDAAYIAVAQTEIEGSYAVQEVNLDADQFTNVIPVPVALLASVPMPAGFVPNATVASQTNFLVAVISYTSPDVQIIDASNVSSDVANNTVISTFTAPVTQKITFNGITCMICAAALNPSNGQLLLSTAQGFYSMDLVAGTFTALPFTPTPAPAANFSLNPTATHPYILTANPTTGETQMLDLTTNSVTTVNSGLNAPGATALDLISDYGVVVDSLTNSESLLSLTNSLSPVFTPIQDVALCGSPTVMNMAAMGVSAASIPSQTIATLLTSQSSANCAGFQTFPAVDTTSLTTGNIDYFYGPMPSTPDGKEFVNGSDPNTITTFNDVYKPNNYGLLVDANQEWIARIGFGFLSNLAGSSPPLLPLGEVIPPLTLCAGTGVQCPTGSVVYLPVPSTEVTLSVPSINFGTVAVGVATPEIPVTVANIGPNILPDQISLGGTSSSEFQLLNSCDVVLQPHSNCAIDVIFAPTGSGGAASATVTVIAGTGKEPDVTQTISLCGNEPSTFTGAGCPTSNGSSSSAVRRLNLIQK